MSEQVLFLYFVLPTLVIIGMVGIWGNFSWRDKDAVMLPLSAQPGFFRFWFSITPRYLLGLRTGMEDVAL